MSKKIGIPSARVVAEHDFRTFQELLATVRPFLTSAHLGHQDAIPAYTKLLNDYASDIRGFDCLSIGGWRPNENQLSDIIAALLDPAQTHGLGTTILKALLRHLAERADLHPEQLSRVRKLLKIAMGDEALVTVKRERIGPLSRADIEVWGREFLLVIEHKVSGGKETFRHAQYQTYRLAEDFRAKAGRFSIPEDNVVFLLLAPDGFQAKNAEFVSLSFETMAQILQSVVIDPESSSLPSILAFARFYGRLS